MKMKALLISVAAIALFAIPAIATAAPPNVTPAPGAAVFGASNVDQSSNTTEIQFQNLSAAPIEIFSFSIGGSDQAQFWISNDGCFTQTLFPGNWCSVSVFFRPNAVGDFSASADILTNQGLESVPLTGSGQAGTFSGTPPTYALQPFFYGNQYGSAQFENVDPTFNLQGYSATITGADAAFFSVNNNGCGGTLLPGNTCNVDVYFNPTAPGTKNATLNLFNNGTDNPATVPLTATALSGPIVSLSPNELDFGAVTTGDSSDPEQVTMTNGGDFELQIQQVFVIGSAPNVFPLINNTCDGSSIAPGDSCTLDVAFTPGASATGSQNGTLFIISNTPGPITTASLHGDGYRPPTGFITLGGKAMALQRMTCQTNGFPAGTSFDYTWFRGSARVGFSRTYRVTEGDVGRRLACLVDASNPASRRSAKTSQSAAVVAADLSRMPGSLVSNRSCRALQAPPSIGRVQLSYGAPVTPADPLLITGRELLTVRIDGQKIATGQRVKVYPRLIQRFGAGRHTLSVGSESAPIVLGSCKLAAHGRSAGNRSTFKLSSSTGMQQVSINALGRSFFRSILSGGSVHIKSLRHPGESFLLRNAQTNSNGIKVRIYRKSIQITGLPQNTGVVRVSLSRGTFSGSRVRFQARLSTAGSRSVVTRVIRR